MEITSVSVRKIEKEGSRMKGIASVLLDDAFAVHDIRIIDGDNGLFIAMPSRKTATGGYRDIAHPINPDVRKKFEDAIIAEYNNTPDTPQEEKINDRKNIIISEIKKINCFDEKEFDLDSIMGNILIKGENLEMIKLDTIEGNVSIKGKINSFAYTENQSKENSILT